MQIKKGLPYGVNVYLFLLFLVLFSGCQQVQPGESRSRSNSFWPIFSHHVSESVDEEGVKQIEDEGDALVLAYWDTTKRYDKGGRLISHHEHSGIWPFYEIDVDKKKTCDNSQLKLLLLLDFRSNKNVNTGENN